MYSIYTVYLSYCYIIWRTNYGLIVSYMPDKPVFSNRVGRWVKNQQE